VLVTCVHCLAGGRESSISVGGSRSRRREDLTCKFILVHWLVFIVHVLCRKTSRRGGWRNDPCHPYVL